MWTQRALNWARLEVVGWKFLHTLDNLTLFTCCPGVERWPTAGDTTGNSLRRLSFLQHRIYNLLGLDPRLLTRDNPFAADSGLQACLAIDWYLLQPPAPPVLWRCWLGGRKGIRPVQNWVVGCWHGYLSGGADLYMAPLMPLPLTVSCFSKIQIGFAFLVPAHLGCPGQRAVKRVCVCVCA